MCFVQQAHIQTLPEARPRACSVKCAATVTMRADAVVRVRGCAPNAIIHFHNATLRISLTSMRAQTPSDGRFVSCEL